MFFILLHLHHPLLSAAALLPLKERCNIPPIITVFLYERQSDSLPFSTD